MKWGSELKSQGVFITGTDTNIGKTFISAGLLAFHVEQGVNARYWKPIQSGTTQSDDTTEVRRLPVSHFEDPVYRLSAPLSPHLAAEAEYVKISLGSIRSNATQLMASGDFWIIEGAGGLHVPLTYDILYSEFVLELGRKGFTDLMLANNQTLEKWDIHSDQALPNSLLLPSHKKLIH